MQAISWEDREGARWVTLEGDLDGSGCLLIKDQFQEAVSGAQGDVILALEGVSFLSSMGVGLLLQARDSLQTGGHQLRLHGVQRPVRRALELMNLVGVFPEV
ncbi:MAG: STAS domain-containing protein [Planctomycetota bacterium]|jgi:anti-anti-sigma factor